MTPRRPQRPTRPSRLRRIAPNHALRGLASLALVGLLALGACDKPTAFGEADSLIVVADSALWSGVEQDTYDALEPPVFTVREEKTFNVTFVANTASELEQLLLWKQVLVFGPADDPRIQAIVDASGREAAVEPGDIVQADNVWARGQLATAIVLDPADPAASWRAALPELHDLLDDQFRSYATSRMWVSGEDTAFAARVADRYGITLRAPQIYHGRIAEDGTIRLRNDRPSPADRIRSILIERRDPGSGAASADAPLDPEAVFAWREGIDSTAYNVPQSIERVDVAPRRFELNGAPAIEVRGIWHDEAAYPAAGPFMARAVRCPDATWFFDAWLYAPHPEDSKYEYMLQLEEILDSFRCSP
ncbi:MAG: DUF4837 family protein [Gemmatimonadales bacterium]|jgi:hypothetical protein